MKKYIAVTVLVCLLLSLAGCHGARGMDAFTMPESFDTSRNYEITFWAKNDTNKTQSMIYQQAIQDFEALYPNVKITVRLYTDYGRIYNDVITNISTQTTPNVCITYPDHIATYMTGPNTMVSLDQLMADSKYGLGGSELRFDGPDSGEIIPKFLEEGIIAGSHYALPYMRSTEACYVNKTFVEKLGFTLPDVLTWDFMWEVADAATAKDAQGNYLVNGQKVMIPILYKSTDNMMIQMLRQKEAGYSTQDGEILILNDTTRQLLDTVADHVALGSFSTFKISSYPANFLNAGQCIFAIDSTAGATWMGTDAPLSDISEEALVRFETQVMTVPQFDTQNPSMISQGPSICIFNKADPQEVLASWLFAQYLLTNSVQIAYAQTEGYVPVTSAAQNSEEYRNYLGRSGEDDSLYYPVKMEATQLLLDNIDNTFVTPVFNGSASLRDAAGQLVESVTKAVKRGETIDDAYIDQLYAEVTALYRLDQNSAGSVAGGKTDLGPLPQSAVILLVSLLGIWIVLGAYVLYGVLRKKKMANRSATH